MKYYAKRQSGFTLIEVSISLLLVSIAFVSFCKIIVFSLREVERSSVRSLVNRVSINEKNRLLSEKFSTTKLAIGTREFISEKVNVKITVKNQSTSLKRVLIIAHFKGYFTKKIFYKSKYIRELKNE